MDTCDNYLDDLTTIYKNIWMVDMSKFFSNGESFATIHACESLESEDHLETAANLILMTKCGWDVFLEMLGFSHEDITRFRFEFADENTPKTLPVIRALREWCSKGNSFMEVIISAAQKIQDSRIEEVLFKSVINFCIRKDESLREEGFDIPPRRFVLIDPQLGSCEYRYPKPLQKIPDRSSYMPMAFKGAISRRISNNNSFGNDEGFFEPEVWIAKNFEKIKKFFMANAGLRTMIEDQII